MPRRAARVAPASRMYPPGLPSQPPLPPFHRPLPPPAHPLSPAPLDASRLALAPKRHRHVQRNPIVLDKRSCTDVICFFLFLAFLAAWGVLAFFAFLWGNPSRLVHPSDSLGRICGESKTTHPNPYNFSAKPYLYFFDLTNCIGYDTVFEGCPTPQVCVEKCPDYYHASFSLRALSGVALTAAAKKVICVSDKIKKEVIDQPSRLTDYIKKDQCTNYVVKSTPVVGRCIPDLITATLSAGATAVGSESEAAAAKANETAAFNQLSDTGSSNVPNATLLTQADGFIEFMLNAKKYGEMILADLHWASWQIFIFLLAAGIVAFSWILLMRWFSGPMVWLSILLVVLAIAGVTAASWVQYWRLTSSNSGIDFKVTLQYRSYLKMHKLWLGLGIVFTIIFVIISLLLIFLRKRIQVAIAMIKESSKAVSSIMTTLGFPILPFMLQLLFAVFWAAVAVHLASQGKPNCRNFEKINTASTGTGSSSPAAVVNGTVCDCDTIKDGEFTHCTFVNFTVDSNFVFYGQAFNLFGLFWGLFFASALCDLTLAGAFASWYWAFRKPDDIPATPLLRSFWRAIRYHLGSLAFGSLILAIIRFVRVILEYMDEKLKHAENPIAQFAMKCLKCCFWCLEKCIKFLNRNAYIMIAIYGSSFCPAAKDAFLLLMRNIVRVWVLDKVADFLLFLGKIIVTIGMGTLSYLYFSGTWSEVGFLVNQLNFYYVPVIVVVCGTYCIADAFFDVYEMAVDTTFLCFLEDSERNDGTAERPYFMSKQIMKILNKKNKFKAVKK